jgi:hypothetical protein
MSSPSECGIEKVPSFSSVWYNPLLNGCLLLVVQLDSNTQLTIKIEYQSLLCFWGMSYYYYLIKGQLTSAFNDQQLVLRMHGILWPAGSCSHHEYG